uniref:Pectate lyase domain-containing protein n=1 Tax=Oryza nivara TaxID=4536 RepID=A0A0E0HSX5_ORYNI
MSHESEELSGRRKLAMTKRKKFAGPCKATYPIDRCRTDWATDRKRLALCAQGFGLNTTGGLAGKFYLVTDGTDDDADEPLWIIFAKEMIINLKEGMMINSDKTIDRRGAHVRITNGVQVTVQNSNNVIIHNIHIHDIVLGKLGMIRDSLEQFGFRTQSDSDDINIFGSTNLDHLSLSNCKDGLIDVIAKSTGVTMHLQLPPHQPQRHQALQLQCRWGYFHVVNNDYTHWLMYAIGGSKNPTIISQGNRYTAPPNLTAKQITKHLGAAEEEWKNWVYMALGGGPGTYFTTSDDATQKQFSNKDLIKPKPGSYVARLTRFAGFIPCTPGKKC